MYDFNYVRPKSLAEAEKALAAAGEYGKLLAGGQTLLPTLKQRLDPTGTVIGLGAIAELRDVKVEGSTVTIAALTPNDVVARSADVRKAIPALAHLAGHIGDPQVRNRGTIGGSLANNDPAADCPAAALGLGATIVTNKRSIAA